MNNRTTLSASHETPMPFVKSSWISTRSPDASRLTEEADRFALARFNAATDEDMVVDDRISTTPSQAVEHRLMALLRGASLPVSHLQLRTLMRGRLSD